MPTAFATTDELDRDELLGAPLRWPRPSALRRELTVTPRRRPRGRPSSG